MIVHLISQYKIKVIKKKKKKKSVMITAWSTIAMYEGQQVMEWPEMMNYYDSWLYKPLKNAMPWEDDNVLYLYL